MTSADGRSANSLGLTPSPRRRLFAALDDELLARVDEADQSRGASEADLTAERDDRRARMRLFRIAVVVRSTGWGFGFVAGLAVVIGMSVVYWTIGTSLSFEHVDALLTGVFFVAYWCGTVWLLAYVVVAVISPATRFSRRVRWFEWLSRRRGQIIPRSTTLLMMQASGKVARVLFRVLTQRFFNAGLRPDVTADVARLCRSIMLRKPSDGVDGFRGRATDVDDYVQFLREVATLVVVERLDMLPLAMTEVRKLFLDSGAGDEDDEETMLRFLQPLRGRTTVAVILEVVLPFAAIGISIAALVVGLFA